MKNHYLIIITFLTFSMVACGNSTEDAATEDQAVVGNTTDAIAESVEEVDEEAAAEMAEVVEEAATELVEDVVVEVKDIEVITSVKGSPKVTEEVLQVKEEILLVVRPNHSAWDGLTKKYVTTSGKVNYKGMRADLSKINTYLAHLKNTPPKKDWSKNEKLAYWINLYNASTVYLVATNYPTSSIKKINGGKPWDKKFVKSGTKTYSLNDIENTIVRPQFKEPRIHAALNCAAVSCPKLLNGAFLPSKLNVQLDSQTRAWIGDATKNKITPSTVDMSKIFEWYAPDFKAGGGAVNFMAKHSNRKYKIDPNAKITYLEYDWALNE
jgi:hypothetical protein